VIQGALKRHILSYLISNPDYFYNKINIADAVLMFQALPFEPGLTFNDKGKITGWRTNRRTFTKKDIETVSRLARAMGLMYSVLSNSEDEKQIKAGSLNYNTLPEKECVSRIVSNTEKDPLVTSFVNIEKTLIQRVIDAGIKLSSLAKQGDENVEASLDILEQFGTIVTDTFNKVTIPGLSSKKDYTRYLGPMIFGDILEYIEGKKINTNASLELIAVRQHTFEPAAYLSGAVPEPDDILIAERIFDVD
jgi:hypothetical protein